jgi:hypothetical protein
MTNTKLTKKEVFGEMRDIFSNMQRDDLVTFVDHELELLAKKSNARTSGITKGQKENEVIKGIIYNELHKLNKPVTITELMNASEVISQYVTENGNKLTNQKISALLKKLVEEDKTITKVIDKRKTYFSIAND